MKINKNKQIILFILLVIINIATVNAISISDLGNHTVAENSTLTIDVFSSNYNGSVAFTKNMTQGTLTKINDSKATFEWTPGFTDAGTYSLKITATDSNDSAIKISYITVTNANTPVQITDKTSIGTIQTSKVSFYVTTDKEATCKYSFSDVSYSSMEYTLLQNTDKTNHSGTTPTLSQGTHTIYVLCKDKYGDVMSTPEEIPFEINLKPSASISLSPNPPLKTERVTVTVTTSEELIDDPQLIYYFDDDTTPHQVTLVGSGTSWYGYIIIRDTDNQRIGTFTFKGTDLTNLEGTQITSGEIFIVDDEQPQKIQSLELTNYDNNLKLVWTYPDKDQDHIEEYKIYKKKGSGGTDLVDYLDTTSKEYFIDDDVDYNEAYYYKVAAVDEAGNEGELSQEVFITHTPILDDETEDTNDIKLGKLNDKLSYKLDLTNELISKKILDIEEVEKNIGRAKGIDKIEAIEALGITTEISEQKTIVKNLQNGLVDLKNYDLSESEFNTRTQTILEQVNEAWEKVPQDVTVTEASTYQELSDDAKTDKVSNKIIEINNLDITEEQKATILEENKKLQDIVTTESKIMKAEINYPGGKEDAVVIKKEINTVEPLENVKIVELIPDIFGEAKISFSKNPTIIEKNSMMSWDEAKLTTLTLTYSAHITANLAEAKLAKTIVAKENFDEYKGNSLTGLVSSQDNSGISSSLLIPLLIGLMVAAILTFYYFYSGQEKSVDSMKGMERGFTTFGSKIKHIHRRIMPVKDDSHKKIIIDEPEKNNLQKIHTEISKISENTTSLADLQSVKEKTNNMRNMLDEIDKKNVEEYTENAKKTFEEALKLILHKDEPVKKSPLIFDKPAPENKCFQVRNGVKLKTINELKNYLEHIDDETFRYHVNLEKNDFSNWIRDVFENYELAHKTRKVFKKEEIKKILES